MGKNDIQVVPVPHKELQDWWNGLTASNQLYVRERIGFLIDLIHIEPQVPLIQALAHFWESSTSSFTIREHELTPTLEEYHATIGVEFDQKMVRPPVGEDPIPMLARYLKVKVETIEPTLKKNMGRIPLQYLITRYTDLPERMSNLSARVFILAFFGFVLFPCSRTAMDPVIACIAQQACFKWDYSNMILAETIMSLNLYQKNQEEAINQIRRKKPKTTFKGSAGMLYMWFIAHIRRFIWYTRVVDIDAITHPLGRFHRTYQSLPKQVYKTWTDFISTLAPEQIRWRIAWPKFPEARLTSSEGDMVPLLGFNGGTAYCPLRVIRQYGMVQEIPPAWSSEPFEFELKHYVMNEEEKAVNQAKVDKIVKELKTSPKQAVVWPEDNLEGEMKTYWASEEYITFVRRRFDMDDEPGEAEVIMPTAVDEEHPGIDLQDPDDEEPPSATKKPRIG